MRVQAARVWAVVGDKCGVLMDSHWRWHVCYPICKSRISDVSTHLHQWQAVMVELRL